MGLENFILTCEKDNELLRKDIDYYKNYNKRLEKQNKELKEKLEQCSAVADTNSELADSIDEHYKRRQKEFIEYLEAEKDRLARECSQIYEDSLGKTRLVSEDIFNELNDVLSKYKEIIGVKDE